MSPGLEELVLPALFLSFNGDRHRSYAGDRTQVHTHTHTGHIWPDLRLMQPMMLFLTGRRKQV